MSWRGSSCPWRIASCATAFQVGHGPGGCLQPAACWCSPPQPRLIRCPRKSGMPQPPAIPSRTAFSSIPEEAEKLAALPMEKVVDALLDGAAAAPLPTAPEWVRDVGINGCRRWSDMMLRNISCFCAARSRNAAELGNLQAWWLQEMIRLHAPLRRIDAFLAWAFHFCKANFSVSPNRSISKTKPGAYAGQFPGLPRSRDARPEHARLPRHGGATRNIPTRTTLAKLQLFTLGVGNYTEKDILETARALTGWDLDAPPGSVNVEATYRS